MKHQYFAGRPNLLTGSHLLTMSLSQQIPAEVFIDSYPTRVWYRGMAPFCQICKSMGHKAADCQHNGKCRECGEAGHLAWACPSRRGGRAWGGWSYFGQRCPPVDAQSFPPLVAPPASAEADVPENSEAISSMDAEDSHVSSGPPSVPMVEVTPSTSGVSLLADVEGMDSDNESVDNVSVINGESKNESSNSIDIVNKTNVVKENVVKINEINVDKENESNDSQASGSMECSGSPSISSFSRVVSTRTVP